MRNIIKRNKKYLQFVFIIAIIGIICGFIYYQFLNNDTKLSIIETLNNYHNFQYNFIIKDLIIMSLILVLSFLIIGLPLSIFYFFFENLSIGFLVSIFAAAFGIKGIIYSLLYILINKLLKYCLMILFLQKTLNIARYIIGIIIYKKDEVIKEKIILNFKNSLYIIVFILIINIILYFLSPYLFKYLAFLLN